MFGERTVGWKGWIGTHTPRAWTVGQVVHYGGTHFGSMRVLGIDRSRSLIYIEELLD